MRVFLPYHLGSGNRGCEGIARGISYIFRLKPEELILYDISSYDYASDNRLGLDSIASIRYRGSPMDESRRFISKVIKKTGNITPYYNFLLDYYTKDLTPNDYIFITGGDIYCYEGQHVLPNMIAKKSKEIGAKTILYGVSMEDKFLSHEVMEGLKYYDRIITRESISSDTLTRKGIRNELFPDPAFSLQPVECDLPVYFHEKDVVGINFSTFTDKSGLFKENMINLIKHIISNNMVVCLIPHVFWKGQDDRKNIKEIASMFSKDVYILDSEKLSYLEIRYIISKCKIFIGGRTHSVISAYCTQTPCIALGYSVKARGLANDIGLPDYTLIDSNSLLSNKQLLESFINLESNIGEVMNIYNNMSEYTCRSLCAKNALL